MTRVLVVETAGLLWGSERALIDLLAGPSNCTFAVCCPPGAPIVAELERLKIRVLPYFVADSHRKGRWPRLQAALGVLKACLEFKPDVIHLNQAGGYRIASVATGLLALPMTAHIRLFEEIPYLIGRRPDPRRLRAVIAISKAVAHELRSAPELAELSVVEVYDAYRLPEVDQVRVPRHLSRVVCAGRIEPMKGQVRLLGALEILKANGAEVECVIAGEGSSDYVAPLKERAAAAALSCTWPGFVADLRTLLRSAGILACPSDRETLGRVILEGWAAGVVPVVYSGSGGAAEIVREANAGIIYDEQTPASLAEGLRRALQLTPSERTAALDRGRAWLAANCSPYEARNAFSGILRGAARRA